MKKILFVTLAFCFLWGTAHAQATTAACSLTLDQIKVVTRTGEEFRITPSVTSGNVKVTYDGAKLGGPTTNIGNNTPALFTAKESGTTVITFESATVSTCKKTISVEIKPFASCAIKLNVPAKILTHKPVKISWSSTADNIQAYKMTGPTVKTNVTSLTPSGTIEETFITPNANVDVVIKGFDKNNKEVCSVTKKTTISLNPNIYTNAQIGCAKGVIVKYYGYAFLRKGKLALTTSTNTGFEVAPEFSKLFQSYDESKTLKSEFVKDLRELYKISSEDKKYLIKNYLADIKMANKSLKTALTTDKDPGVLSQSTGLRQAEGAGCNLKGFPVPTLY